MSELQALCGDENLSSIQQDEGESEFLLHFLLLVLLMEETQDF